ncbi:MAG TPA: glycosyltransferase family 39 protein [Acidimicrobiia bacterium]
MLTVIAVAALTIRVVYVLVIARGLPLGTDSTWYLLVSGPLSDGRGFLNPSQFFSGHVVATAGYPPGYPTFLALVTRLVGSGRDTFTVAGALMGTITVVLTGCIGRRLAGSAVGLVAAALAALYPMLIAVDGSLMSETLSIPLLYAAVFVAITAMDRPGYWRWALVGLLLGLVALTRADAVVTVVVLVGACALALPTPLRTRVLTAGVTLGVVALVVLPWVVRNDQRVGEPTVATISSSATIAGANCASTYSGSLKGYWDFDCMDAARQNTLGEARWTRFARTQGIDYATGHIAEVPLVVAVRELRLLGLYDPIGQMKLETIESRSRTWLTIGWVVWLPIMVLGAFGLPALVRIRRRAVPLLAVIGSTVLVVAASYGNQRFRTAIEPAVLVAAALTLTRWIPALSRRIEARVDDAPDHRAV